MALLLAGCVEADLVPCGALSCPSGQQCVDGARCVTQHSIDECADRTIGEACSVDNLAGRCADLAGVRLCEPATCGDSVIDPPLHEACDGAAPFAAQCVDLGYDLGRPACAADCELDASPCTRFGWETVIDAQVAALWTDGTVLAAGTRSPARLEVHGGAFDLGIAMTVDQLGGGGGRVFARSGVRVFEVTPAGVVDVTPPAAILNRVTTMAVTSDGNVLALDGCSIARFAMSWARIATEPGNCGTIHTGLGGRIFVHTGGSVVQELTPGGFAPAFNVDASIIALRFTDTAAYIATSGSLSRWQNGRIDTLAPGEFRDLAVAGDAVYARRADGTAVRWRAGQIDGFAPPGALLGDDGKSTLYAFGGPLSRFSGAAFGDLAPLPGGLGEVAGASSIGDDGILYAATTKAIWAIDPTGSAWRLVNAPSTRPRALSVRTPTAYAFSTHDEGTIVAAVVRRHLQNDLTYATDAEDLPGVYLAPDGTTYAAGWKGADGWLGRAPLLDTMLVTRPPECAFHAITGAGTRVLAGGTCHGAPSIWELSAGAWTELHRATSIAGTVRGLLLVGDEIFATGDEGTLHFARGAWTLDPSVRGSTISGTAPDDVWLSGSFVPVQRWDGRAWSKMTTRALGPIVVAADARRVYLPGAAKDHVSLLRDPR